MPLRIQDFHRRFGSESDCLLELFNLQYKKAECPACYRENAYHPNPNKPCYTCVCGRNHIYPRTGTIFENSAVPLVKWFTALFFFATEAKVSAKEIERRLKVAYPTAWRIKNKIRSILPASDERLPFDKLLKACITDTKVSENAASAVVATAQKLRGNK